MHVDNRLVCLVKRRDSSFDLHTCIFFSTQHDMRAYNQRGDIEDWRKDHHASEVETFAQEVGDESAVLDGEGNALPPFVKMQRYESARDRCEYGSMDTVTALQVCCTCQSLVCRIFQAIASALAWKVTLNLVTCCGSHAC